MQRTTIRISEELHRQLQRIATERGDSMAAVICEALEEKARGYRPRSLGIGASGHTDTARKAGDGRPVRDQGISALTISSR